jgi:hypothetical protein
VTGTRHSCNGGAGPAFGRKTPGCLRCDELAAGAAPRSQPWRQRETRAQADARMRAELAAHFASARHRSGGCGPVCTFGDW